MKLEYVTRGILPTSFVFLSFLLTPVLKLNAGEIHEAVKAGDATKVQTLLEEGAYINSTPADGFGWTPLHFAIAAGDTRIAEMLLARGASLTARAFTDEVAIALIKSSVWETRIKAESDARFANSKSRFDYYHGSTPLDFAVKKKNLEMVRLLLSKGADVNLANSEKWTPLHIAAEMGDSEMALLLLQNGADVNALTSFGMTPWDMALGIGHKEMKRLLAPQ